MENYKKYPSVCIDCGKVRSIKFIKGKPSHTRCNSCANRIKSQLSTGNCHGVGAEHPSWKGGNPTNGDGYVLVLLDKGDPFYQMATTNDKYVKRSRLVLVRDLGRCLIPEEQVHRINGDKADDRLENLQLLTVSEHSALHGQKYEVK